MKKLFSSAVGKEGITDSFTLKAYKSEISGEIICKQALHCIKPCYANDGTYRFSNVKAKHEWNYEQSKKPEFVAMAVNELGRKRKKPSHFRIHTGGDFYSLEYLLKWFEIAKRFPEITFYAYTKEVAMVKEYRFITPKNLEFIFSYGGKQDHLIDPENDRHSLVFAEKIDLVLSGYADASDNDLVALGNNKRIGLHYHNQSNDPKKNTFKNVEVNYA